MELRRYRKCLKPREIRFDFNIGPVKKGDEQEEKGEMDPRDQW